MSIYFLLGLLIATAGCSCLYLASRHQRWISKPYRTQPARSIGFVLLLSSVVSLQQDLSLAATVFTWIHWIMLLLVMFPYLGVLLTRQRA